MPYLDNGTTPDADGPLNLARAEAFLLTIEKRNNLDFSIHGLLYLHGRSTLFDVMPVE